ncbi:uncharacterized protein LOC132607977 [Lycium barbarum]|uniref:uncharacterized protein LOC132607977 n=1 Tax=Lycium barbarum TaxID=112863 RepID=UPI00293EF36D|nr:uncharacterized protein LOC132607977 [Lycium barbarum]
MDIIKPKDPAISNAHTKLREDKRDYIKYCTGITLKLFLQEHNRYLVTTLVYVKCDDDARLQLWDSIYHLSSIVDVPWMVSGEFNVVMNEEEKIGGPPVLPQDFEDFPFCINSCEMMEPAFKGSPFTWWNGRAVASSQKWGATFLDTVKDNWPVDSDGDPFLSFKKKMKQIKDALSIWSKVAFGDIFKQLIIREDIVRIKEQLFEEEPTVENISILQLAQVEMKKYLHYEEEFWKQKSGYTWFSEGDGNTKFFHSIVKGRRKRLQVKKIQESDGLQLENEDQIAARAVHFFQSQFTQEVVVSDYSMLRFIPRMVSDECNLQLCAIPSFDEVKKAVFELKGDSACGPNGLSGTFYQTC